MTGQYNNTGTHVGKGLALPPDVELGPYRIIRKIGQGGFGITYLACDIESGERVVIKENMPTFYAYREDGTLTVYPHDEEETVKSYAHTLTRFVDEARTLARLKHPNIVQVLRAFEALGTAYYVMPYVEGSELQAAAPAMPDEAWLAPILRSILGALAYLHSQNLLHRDLKPGNILLRHDGTPILIDFGTARTIESNRSSTKVGTPGYTPVEQMTTGGKCGPWTDIYALGATCYRIITGERPPDSFDRMGGTDSYIPLTTRPELRERFSRRFLKSIDTAMALRADARWQSAGEWLQALSASAPEVSVPIAAISPVPGTPAMPLPPAGAIPPVPGTPAMPPPPAMQLPPIGAQPVAHAPLPVANAQQAGESDGGKKIFLILGFIVLILLAGGGGAYFYMQTLEDERRAEAHARIEQEQRLRERALLVEKLRLEEEQRRAEEQRRRAEEERRAAEEQRRREEEERRAEERRRREEEERRAEEQRRREEEERRTEEQRRAEEQRRREEEERRRREEELRNQAVTSVGAVMDYLNARAQGNSYAMQNFFADTVQYKYKNYRYVSRSTVIDDIQSGWNRWVYRNYHLVSLGVNGNVVEVVYSFNLSESNRRKNAHGYTKETWHMNDNGQIYYWDEQINKNNAPSLSPNMKQLY